MKTFTICRRHRTEKAYICGFDNGPGEKNRCETAHAPALMKSKVVKRGSIRTLSTHIVSEEIFKSCSSDAAQNERGKEREGERCDEGSANVEKDA